MEKLDETLIDTQWAIDHGATMGEIRVLERYFPKGGKPLEVIEKLVKEQYEHFAIWFLTRMRFKEYENTILELDKITTDSFIHFGTVQIYSDVTVTGLVLIKDDLKVSGKLTITDNAFVYASTVSAHEICIKGNGYLYSEVQAFSS